MSGEDANSYICGILNIGMFNLSGWVEAGVQMKCVPSIFLSPEVAASPVS
jgi:hypothetical protein